MKRLFFVLTAAVATALVLGVGVGAIAAQVDEPDAGNVTDVIESETEADTLEHQQSIRLGSNTEIVGWEFVGGNVRLGVDTDRPASVTISDGVAGMGEQGAVRPPTISQRVYPEEKTVIVMPVEEFQGGHSVTVSAGGEGVRLSTDMETGDEDPLNHFGGHSGLFSGMLMALLMALGGAGFVLWREDKGVKKA